METSINLNEVHWQIAHAIAIELVKTETDSNELNKVFSYLQAYKSREEAGTKFFDYLATLARNGNKIGHSKKTIIYYENINIVCHQYLKGYQNNVSAILQILGWTKRLMRYYKDAVPIGELNSEEIDLSASSLQSERQVEIAEIVASQEFTLGHIVEAMVTNPKGNKVTYEILKTIKLTQKEPKIFKTLQEKEGQLVKVEIVELREDGSIKKVKYIE